MLRLKEGILAKVQWEAGLEGGEQPPGTRMGSSFWDQSTESGKVIHVQRSNTALLTATGWEGRLSAVPEAKEGCQLRDPAFVRQH